MSLSSSNIGRQRSPSRTIRKTPALVLNQKYSPMPVSGAVGGLALPAYTGGRPLELKQHGDHAPRSGGPAPGAQRRESGGGNRHAAKALANREVRA